MKWIEVIELRASGANRDILESTIERLVKEVDGEKDGPTIKSYIRGVMDTDYSVHLRHNSQAVEKEGSALGLHIAGAIKPFGLVNHSTWVEKT